NPPFGDQSVFDPVHPEWSDDAPSIHNYFFRKGLEQLQPGGVQSFVVSRYFLDAGDTAYTEFRQRLHRDAELLTAVRLPRNAFMANAGTQVVTDVIFFRKRMEPLPIDEKTVYPDWVSADGIIGQDPDTGRGVPGNRYYEKHPDHLMGIPALGRGMYREDEPVILPNKGDDMDLGDRIRSVIVPELAGKNLVWPESRMLAEARWKNRNRLYPVTQSMKDGTPSGSFFMVYADPAVAREERGFQFTGDEDHEIVQERLNVQCPPRLAVRTSGYRGFAFAEELMVPVSVKKPAKNEDDAAVSDLPEEDEVHPAPAEGITSAGGTGNVPMKRAFSDTEIQRVTGMVHIRDALQALLRAQVNEHMVDEDVEARRSALTAAYDTFTKKYGLLNRPINRRVFRQDTFSGALQALEKEYLPEISAAVARKTGEDARPESAEKVALFTERTQYPHQIQDRAENPQDALRLSLSQFGRVDPVFIQSSLRDTEWAGDWSGSIRDALKEDLYLDLDAAMDSEFWNEPMIAWPYQEKALALSGDILDKSERVQELLSRMQGMDVLVGIDEVSRLMDALEWVRPQPVPMKDIGVRFGASWVDSGIYAQFAKEIMGAMGEPVFHYEKALAKWDVSAMFPPEQTVRWGVQGERSPHWVLLKTLNRQPLLVTQRLSDGSTVVMEKETEIAKQKSQEIQKEWSRWVYSNEAVGERLEEAYNQTFNRFAPPQYDGRHLDLIGSSAAITLRPHQKNAIWRGMQSGKTFFDHAVGAGKTFAAVGLAMEMRRLGRAQKPMVVVPNHLVDQWRGAFLDLYPSAAVLTAMPVDMDGKNRQVFLGKVAYGDWDAVIIPHSLFSRIPPDAHWSSVVMKEEVSGFEDAIRTMEKLGDNADKRTIKQLERKVERIKSKIASAQSDTGKKDAGLTMGDIGVDFLFVDEVQEFKNLPYITEMKNVAGLGNPEGSAKAQDLYIKSRSIQKMREDNGGVVYLSGTPLSNTMAELYTWMRHFAYEELDRMGILHFDAWQNAFADVSRDYAFTMTGQYKEKAYLSVFDNLPELRALTQQFMDTISIADVRRMLADEGMPDMPIPPIAGGKPNVVVCQPTRDQQVYIGVEVGENEDGTPKFNEGSILDRLDNLPKRPEKGEDNILSLSGEMSKVGLDLRAVTGRDNGDGDADNGMKLLRCADDIAKLYAQWADDRGTQLVFLDFSTPVSSRKGAVRKPTASEQGILDALDAVRRYERDLEDFGEADDALQQKAERAQELLENISPQELEDVENKYLGGEDRWSAYEALRRILVEKGIPAEEIAFIHEYEKPQEKAELFGMMRSGKLRVLM
ncbi:MAG: DEAD/DEAH box helicase family protein, partial [Acidithiobacillus sp.]